MRRLGIVGGMSWESTAEYYRMLNRGVSERLGGLHSAPLLIHSVDFAEVAALQETGAWEAGAAMLSRAARGLEAAGAQGILLATNTMHQVADTIAAAVSVPFLHIVDPTGEAMRGTGIRRAGLIGTRYTMELPFWGDRLKERFDIELISPDADGRATIHRIIYQELVRGIIRDVSREAYAGVIARLGQAGAEAVVLGCTEISLLIKPGDVPEPLFDTTALHVASALDFITKPHAN